MKYEIKGPRWMRNFFYVFGGLGLMGQITIVVLYAIGVVFVDDFYNFIWCEISFAIFEIFAILGIYVWWREVFRFRDGVFTYTKPFKRSQAAKASDIAVVKKNMWGRGFLKVIFLNSNGEILISFLDDGTAFRDGSFQKALNALNIPLQGIMHDSFIDN